jgi:hypothetical protein
MVMARAQFAHVRPILVNGVIESIFVQERGKSLLDQVLALTVDADLDEGEPHTRRTMGQAAERCGTDAFPAGLPGSVKRAGCRGRRRIVGPSVAPLGRQRGATTAWPGVLSGGATPFDVTAARRLECRGSCKARATMWRSRRRAGQRTADRQPGESGRPAQRYELIVSALSGGVLLIQSRIAH